MPLAVPAQDWRVIWVECDEQGRPIRTTYVPARGDVPSDDKALLPWKTEFQGPILLPSPPISLSRHSHSLVGLQAKISLVSFPLEYTASYTRQSVWTIY